jgi:hypothetical protein
MIIDIKEKFRVISAEDGFVLTTYTGDDIRNYGSFSNCYVPLTSDISYIREISIDEDANLTAERDKALAYDNTKEYNR